MKQFLLEVDDSDFQVPITAKEIADALLEAGYGFMKIKTIEEVD